MRRLTTDAPTDNIQTALNLFYIEDGWVWVRGGGSAPEYLDTSLCDYIRNIVKVHIPSERLPADDDKLSMVMSEWLLEGYGTAEGVIATLYTAGWAFAELRHKLMAYEDTGLEPEDLHSDVDLDLVRVVELLKADAEGRIVVLPEPPKEENV